MPLQTLDYRKGIRKSTPVASVTVAATAVTVHTLSAGRTVEIKKIIVDNRNVAPGFLSIGTGLGVAFVAAMPPFLILNGTDIEFTEDMIPDVEFTANITVQMSVASVAANDTLVQFEVSEIMGPTG